jgi:hypothetical protein
MTSENKFRPQEISAPDNKTGQSVPGLPEPQHWTTTLEQKLLEGDFDWSLILPSPTLMQIRNDLIQGIQEEVPDWDKTKVVQMAARLETTLKVQRLEQLRQLYGESDARVVQLREDIDYWKALLETQPPPNKEKR